MQTLFFFAEKAADECGDRFGLGQAARALKTAGLFAYFYAMADSEQLAMSARIIASFCAASVLWSRIFLKEKLSWKHYAMIALIVAGIAIMGVFDL